MNRTLTYADCRLGESNNGDDFEYPPAPEHFDAIASWQLHLISSAICHRNGSAARGGCRPFFSDDAIAKANDTIAQIKRDSGKDLYIESYPAIPADRKASYNPQQRGQFFSALGG